MINRINACGSYWMGSMTLLLTYEIKAKYTTLGWIRFYLLAGKAGYIW